MKVRTVSIFCPSFLPSNLYINKPLLNVSSLAFSVHRENTLKRFLYIHTEYSPENCNGIQKATRDNYENVQYDTEIKKEKEKFQKK